VLFHSITWGRWWLKRSINVVAVFVCRIQHISYYRQDYVLYYCFGSKLISEVISEPRIVKFFLEENGPRLPRYYVVTHAFSPLNLKCLPLPLLSASECLSHRDAITRYCFSFRWDLLSSWGIWETGNGRRNANWKQKWKCNLLASIVLATFTCCWLFISTCPRLPFVSSLIAIFTKLAQFPNLWRLQYVFTYDW